MLEGEYFKYYSSGFVQEKGEYQHSKKQGLVIKYHPNSKRVSNRVVYKNDSIISEFVYDWTGNKYKPEDLIDIDFSLTDGYKNEYYNDCKIKTQYYLKNKHKEGDCFNYYPNGILKSKVKFIDGEKVGWEFIYNDNGSLQRKVENNIDFKNEYFYFNGKVISHLTDFGDTLFHTSGRIVEVRKRKNNYFEYYLFNENGDISSFSTNNPFDYPIVKKTESNCTFGIMKNSQWMSNQNFNYISEFVNSTAECQIGKLNAVIDTTGKLITPLDNNKKTLFKTFNYLNYKFYKDHELWTNFFNNWGDYYVINHNNLFGLSSYKGGEIFKPEYNSISLLNNGNILFSKNGKLFVLKKSNANEMISLGFSHNSINKMNHHQLIDDFNDTKPEITIPENIFLSEIYQTHKYHQLDLYLTFKTNTLNQKVYCGVSNSNGIFVIPQIYDQISTSIYNNEVWAKKDSSFYIYDFEGKLLNKITGNLYDQERYFSKTYIFMQVSNKFKKHDLYNRQLSKLYCSVS